MSTRLLSLSLSLFPTPSLQHCLCACLCICVDYNNYNDVARSMTPTHDS